MFRRGDDEGRLVPEQTSNLVREEFNQEGQSTEVENRSRQWESVVDWNHGGASKEHLFLLAKHALADTVDKTGGSLALQWLYKE